MAAKDTFHETVKSALSKDGWSITHDPLYINFADLYLAIPVDIYDTFFARRFVQLITQEYRLKLIIFDWQR